MINAWRNSLQQIGSIMRTTKQAGCCLRLHLKISHPCKSETAIIHFEVLEGGKHMDFIMIAVLAGSFALLWLLVNWCEKQVEKM